MNDDSIDSHHGEQPPDQADRHADKYNDPRVRITPRGVLLLVLVFVFGIIGAAASVYLRRTRLEQTTRFWGQETITALQLAERMELLARGGNRFEPVELSGTPGLGHLRRLLLDERNYDWQSETARSIDEMCDPETSQSPHCVQLRLTDPTAKRFGTVEIDIDLASGWIGPSGGDHRVRVAQRVRPKLQNYFAQIIHVTQKTYDER